MKILAIDTATEGCSAALLIDGEIKEKFEVTPRGHTQRILPMVDELLNDAAITLKGLDAIAFDRGPGSFTGLRITAGVVQGLAYGADLPVIPISSLAALAISEELNNNNCKTVVAAIDARMGEVYTATYLLDDARYPQLQGVEQVIALDKIELPTTEWIGVGTGWEHSSALPHARAIVKLAVRDFNNGYLLSAAEAQPLYIRDKVVHN